MRAAASREARESEPRRSDDLAELIQRRAAAAANDAGRMRPPLVLVLSAAAATPPLADAAPITCQPLRAFPGAADFPTYGLSYHGLRALTLRRLARSFHDGSSRRDLH